MNGIQTVSKQTLVPVLQAGTACTHCTAVLPCSGYTHWPAAAHTGARGVGSDGCDGEKHKKCFFSLQAEKEVSHLDMYSSQAGKGTRHWEKRSRGLGGTASPRGCETDGRFGSGVVTERPASFFRCKSTQHNTAQGLPAQPGRFAGGVASFQTCCIQKAASEMLHGQFSLGKRLSRIRGKMGGKAERLSLASLHKPTFPTQRATQPGWCSGKGWQPLS